MAYANLTIRTTLADVAHSDVADFPALVAAGPVAGTVVSIPDDANFVLFRVERTAGDGFAAVALGRESSNPTGAPDGTWAVADAVRPDGPAVAGAKPVVDMTTDSYALFVVPALNWSEVGLAFADGGGTGTSTNAVVGTPVYLDESQLTAFTLLDGAANVGGGGGGGGGGTSIGIALGISAESGDEVPVTVAFQTAELVEWPGDASLEALVLLNAQGGELVSSSAFDLQSNDAGNTVVTPVGMTGNGAWRVSPDPGTGIASLKIVDVMTGTTQNIVVTAIVTSTGSVPSASIDPSRNDVQGLASFNT